MVMGNRTVSTPAAVALLAFLAAPVALATPVVTFVAANDPNQDQDFRDPVIAPNGDVAWLSVEDPTGAGDYFDVLRLASGGSVTPVLTTVSFGEDSILNPVFNTDQSLLFRRGNTIRRYSGGTISTVQSFPTANGDIAIRFNVNGSHLAFWGQDSAETPGIYRASPIGATPQVVAAPGTAPVPAAFNFLNTPGVNASGQIAFTAVPATFPSNTGQLYRVSPTNTVTPVDLGPDLAPFGAEPVINDLGTIAVITTTPAGVRGLYTVAADDTLTFIADTSGPLSIIDEAAINNNGDVVFLAMKDGQGNKRSLFFNGTEILGPGTDLLGDGRLVEQLFLSTSSFNDAGVVSARAALDDGTLVIFTVSGLIPEPATLGLLAAPALLLQRRRR